MTDFTLGPGPLTPEFEQVKSDIGIVENGNTATHAIPSGYYVIWKGDLYVAKTDISSGTALSAASGGNLTAKTQGLGAEIISLRNDYNTARTLRLNNTSVTSDDALRQLPTGAYLMNDVTDYTPNTIQYGTVYVMHADGGYGFVMIIGTTKQNIYIRHFHKDGWHTDFWQELATIEDISVNEYVISGGLVLRRFGQVCTINGYASWSEAKSNETEIGILPKQYRPKFAIRALANVGENAWTSNKIAYFTIDNSTGKVSVKPADSTGYKAMYVSCSWVI